MKKLAAIALATALAGCSTRYDAPPEPSRAPAPGRDDEERFGHDVISLSHSDPEARAYARNDLVNAGLAAGPWLFEGADDKNGMRSEASREILDGLRKQEWREAPPVGEAFAARLAEFLKPGHPLRSYAWWWVAMATRLEDARRIVPDPAPSLTDADADVRRYAAILYVREGHDVRRLANILDEALEQAVRSRGSFESWQPVLASLAAAGFDEGEMLEVRDKLRSVLERAGADVPWWEVRSFFRRCGPGAEPLLVSAIIYEPPGDLRRLAALSYGAGTQLKGELERAFKAKPNDDLAIALGNAGSPSGVKLLAALLEKSPLGSRDRWAAALALEKGTGKWLGDATGDEEAAEAAARWRALADSAGQQPAISFSCDDGGAMLARHPSGLEWRVGIGPIVKNLITRDEPGWAVFYAAATDESSADADLLLAWRLNRDRFLMAADLMCGDGTKNLARAERMIARAVSAASGGAPDIEGLDDAVAAARTRRGPGRGADRTKLGDPRADEAARAAALRRLAFGGDEEAAAIEAFLDTNPSTLLRRAAYQSLWQMDSETSLLALAGHAGDAETKMSYTGSQDTACLLLLRIRFSCLGYDRLDAAGNDPVKWEALVREAFRK